MLLLYLQQTSSLMGVSSNYSACKSSEHLAEHGQVCDEVDQGEFGQCCWLVGRVWCACVRTHTARGLAARVSRVPRGASAVPLATNPVLSHLDDAMEHCKQEWLSTPRVMEQRAATSRASSHQIAPSHHHNHFSWLHPPRLSWRSQQKWRSHDLSPTWSIVYSLALVFRCSQPVHSCWGNPGCVALDGASTSRLGHDNHGQWCSSVPPICEANIYHDEPTQGAQGRRHCLQVRDKLQAGTKVHIVELRRAQMNPCAPALR